MERRQIKRNGNSMCVNLDKGTLENVYGVGLEDEVLIDYAYPEIIITIPKALERFQKKTN